MALTYAELTKHVQETIEDVFTSAQLAIWTEQVEQKIYATVQFPALRKNQISTLTASNRFVTLPTDYLFPYSFAVIDGNGRYEYLLNKEVSFIREAYPSQNATGLPKHYAPFDADTFILGPTPDANYQVQLHYGYYPESIVTAGTTWLGDKFDSALFNGVMLEAARFTKAEADMVSLYQNMYIESIAQLKMLGDGKLKQDSYREGLPKVPVT